MLTAWLRDGLNFHCLSAPPDGKLEHLYLHRIDATALLISRLGKNGESCDPIAHLSAER